MMLKQIASMHAHDDIDNFETYSPIADSKEPLSINAVWSVLAVRMGKAWLIDYTASIIIVCTMGLDG